MKIIKNELECENGISNFYITVYSNPHIQEFDWNQEASLTRYKTSMQN